MTRIYRCKETYATTRTFMEGTYIALNKPELPPDPKSLWDLIGWFPGVERIGNITDHQGLHDAAILMQKFIDLPHWKSKAEWQREFPWIGARRINYDDDWSPGESLYGWVGDPIKKLFDRAISLGYSEDAPNLEEKSSALVGLNKLIKWAKSEIPEEVEALENGQKVKPEDVIAEFREGRKPDGEILTVPYLIKSVDWPDFKNSKQFSDATDAKLLTRWIKVGRAYAYLYTELSAMSRGDSMKDGA